MIVRASLLRLVAAIVAIAFPSLVHAQSDGGIISPDAVAIAGDVRLIGVDGETSWLDGGYGKTRFDTDSARRTFRIGPQAVEGDLIWTPRFSWALSGTAVVVAQQGQDHPVDLSEAYLSYKPLIGARTKLTVRGGLFWPPVSREHVGPEWRTRDTITPSTINSWIGEEVKVAGVEAQITRTIGAQRVSLTAALFGLNDTAGTLLAFRGWAAGDQKAVAFGLQPLPPLDPFMQGAQAAKTRPVIELDNRPGFYARVGWAAGNWLDVDLLHYDNRGDPQAVTPTLQWGWHTRFDNLGATLTFGDWQLRSQGMLGRTEMGFPMGGRIWVDTRFRSAYVMATRNFVRGSVSVRGEAFGTTSLGSVLGRDYSEDGWSLTVAGRRDVTKNLTLMVEALHIDSSKNARIMSGLAPTQDNSLVQVAFRLHL